MIHKPDIEEILSRIEKNLSKHDSAIPREVVSCWYGYLGALLEWGLIEVDDHHKLCRLLPEINDNPVVEIMLGN